MDFDIFLLFFAFALGLKHSMDIDHTVAISGFLVRSKNVMKTVKLSTAWALGHMLTAGIITVLLFTFKETFLDRLLGSFELIVAFMLIFIGVLTILWEFNIVSWGKHSHGHVHKDGVVHAHDEENTHDDNVSENNASHDEDSTPVEHAHLNILSPNKDYKTLSGIGVIHGLASNDELLLLLTLTLELNSVWQGLIGVVIFTFGVVVGMILYSIIIKLPISKFGQERTLKTINLVIGGLTIIYGLYILFGGEGLNPFEGLFDN